MEFTNYIPSLEDFINLCSSDAFSKKEITQQSQCARRKLVYLFITILVTS